MKQDTSVKPSRDDDESLLGCLFTENLNKATQEPSNEVSLTNKLNNVEPLKLAPRELEDKGQDTVDDLVKINLGTEEDMHPTFVSACLSEEE